MPLLKGRITERSAILLFLILCIVCVRLLKAPKYSTDSIQLSSSCRNEYDVLKKYYELGFEDGSNGLGRGASMIPETDTCANERGSSFDSETVESSPLEKKCPDLCLSFTFINQLRNWGPVKQQISFRLVNLQQICSTIQIYVKKIVLSLVLVQHV